jgi:hypothetical protein
LIILHTPGGKEVAINSDAIVSMRDGEHKGEYLSEAVGCMINTNDGKFVSVVESCEAVREKITGGTK